MYFPRWKIVLIAVMCLAGCVFAAPNLISAEQAERLLPGWLQPVNLGLDLQGGSHLVLEVQTDAVLKEQLTSLVESARTILRKERIRYADLGIEARGVTVRILDDADKERARELLRKLEPNTAIEIKPDGAFTIQFNEQAVIARANSAVEQSIEIVRRRVDELGTREPGIVRQGKDRIIVQLPGIRDPERIKTLLGKTAKLAFHLVDVNASVADALRGHVPPGDEVVPGAEKDASGQATQYVLRKKVEVGGDALVDSQPTFQNGEPVVSFRFDSNGGRRFGQTTKDNVGRPFAIVLDGKVISAPVIREPIMGGSGIISGHFTTQSAQDLALLLRAGALPAPLLVLEERTVGPDLGADSIRSGQLASLFGLLLVVVFMVLYYGILGIFADIALLINLILLMAGLSLLGATLTLPGIAGIVLTMGMAVDANVLIYERIREEYRNGRTIMSAVNAGFDRAFVTILDSNLTTLVAAALLFQFGSGPVRGFAVTLTLGLITSMFTAIMVTRLMIVIWLRSARPKTLPV